MRLLLSHKISLLVVAAALASGLAVGYADYERAANAMRLQAKAGLSALMEARRVALDQYLASIRRDLKSQAGNPFIHEALGSFAVGWEEIGDDAAVDLRTLYIERNPYAQDARQALDHPNDPSIYSLAHNRFHPRLRAFVELYGYEDLLLIAPDGRVLYSVMKRDDFATDLRRGPHRASGLGQAYAAVLGERKGVGRQTSDGQVFVDFERYGPRGGKPTGFVAAPLIGEVRNLVGILVFQMPTDRIDAVMQVAAGMGRSGDTFIVGPDYLMRSNARNAPGPTLLERRLDTAPVRAALLGESGVMDEEGDLPDGRHTRVLSAFAPLTFMDTRWAVIATAELAEVRAPVDRMRQEALATGLGLTVIIAALGLAVTRRLVVAPLTTTAAVVRAMAGGDRSADRVGDLPDATRADEIGDIARALVLFRDSLDERDRLITERALEKEAREARRKLAEAIEAISDGFALYDRHDRLVLANSRFRELYPRNAGLITPGMLYEDFVRHGALAGDVILSDGGVEGWVSERLAQFHAPGPPVERRFADGRWLRIADFKTEDGGTVCIRTDISALKAREQALAESEERYRQLIDLSPDGIMLHDAGGIVFLNPAGCRLLGLPDTTAALGRHYVDFVAPEERAVAGQRVRAIFEDGENLALVERAIRTADGRDIVVEVTAIPFLDDGRRLALVVFRDITDRLRAERELAAHRDHLEEIIHERTAALVAAEGRLITAINTFKGGFALYDADERLVIINEQVYDFMPEVADVQRPGVGLEEVTRAIAAAKGLDEGWIADRLAHYRGEEEYNGEWRLPDGRWLETNIRKTPDRSILFVINDITAHKNAATALEQALAKERELGQLQREFVSMASHEFRTPLAIIDASIQRILRRHATLSPQALTELGEEIRSAVARMVGLIDAILGASRLDSGEIRFQPAPCDLRALVADVCRRHAALSADHTLAVEVAALPASVVCDAALVDHMITNLLSNAVKYSPRGGAIIVRGWTEAGDALLAVSDQGVGIPAADLPRMFQRFFRARTSTGITGTGIGLHFVKRLVELHGGAIDVQSVEGKGTTFTLRLPCAGRVVARPAEVRDVVPEGDGI